MRCTRCHRPLIVPAATVTTRHGASNYGPVCAERMGLSGINRAALPAGLRRPRAQQTTTDDPAQMALELDHHQPEAATA